METNARTKVLISGRIIGTHCDRRDAWPCHWWKKEGLLYIPNKSGRKYGIYGQTWQCLMKKTPPHEKTGTSAPSALHNPPFAPVPAFSPFPSAYHILVFTACFSHGKPVFRTFDDIWWHLMTPFWKSVFYSDLAHIFEVSKQFINPKKKRYGTRKEPERKA